MFCVFCGAAIDRGSASCPVCKAAAPPRKGESPTSPSEPPRSPERYESQQGGQQRSPQGASPIGQPVPHKPSAQPGPKSPPRTTGQRPYPVSPSDPQGDRALIGRTLVRRYRLVEKIGSGASGSVYRADDLLLGQFAAVKILSPDRMNSLEGAARFQREASVAVRIAHPNAVSTLDSGVTEDGLAYIAMEYVEGQTLTEVMKTRSPIPLSWIVNVTGQAAAALGAAHQLNIVHRDFKPDNVMICRQADGTDIVKVLDFGVAKVTAVDPAYQALTQTGFVVGTPQYMSPEQVKNEPLSARSDLYSLAVVVYEMLTGSLPFAGKLQQQQMFNRILEDPLPFSVVNPRLALPPEVEMVVMKALSRKSDERYASTVEFAVALAQAARDSFEPSPAVPSQPWAAPPAPGIPPSAAYALPSNSAGQPDGARNRPGGLIWIMIALALLLFIAVFGVLLYVVMR